MSLVRGDRQDSEGLSDSSSQTRMTPHAPTEAISPPPSYTLVVDGLTIAAPRPRMVVPLAIPIPIPVFIQRLMRRSSAPETPREEREIVRKVSMTVEAGSICAMSVPSRRTIWGEDLRGPDTASVDLEVEKVSIGSRMSCLSDV